MVDKRAWKILKDMHWESDGWRTQYVVPTGDDYNYAVSVGYIIEDRELSWKGVIDWARRLLGSLSPHEVGDGFLVSLSGDYLPLRSALGAYAVLSEVNLDARQQSALDRPSDIYGSVEGVSAYNFTASNFCRYMWGTSLHTSIPDMCFCLEKFQEEGCPEVTDEHLSLLRNILDTIESLPPESRPHDLEQALKPVLKSTKQQRTELIQSLGYAGILVPKSQDTEIPRNVPVRYNYFGPVEAWRAKDGFDKVMLNRYFPKLV
ncbi:MAG: hypothetical protein KDD66_03590 [Bdellovibrionales bacterium]|nr:hypothetical protein [Bdellovibrionales bacterium]